ILPMIPILSSLIIVKSNAKFSKNIVFSLSYLCFFMSLAYAIAGVIASFLGASIQGILQKPIILILFATNFHSFCFAMF
ncbi:thiol:disulfide interchange protein, partial [Campylobacter jejuni]|nr:thiol:disulfide interchange protein [Campylobacter jejuni]